MRWLRAPAIHIFTTSHLSAVNRKLFFTLIKNVTSPMRLIILPTCMFSMFHISEISRGFSHVTRRCIQQACQHCLCYSCCSLTRNISNCQAVLGLRKFRPNYPRDAFILQNWGERLCDKPSGA